MELMLWVPGFVTRVLPGTWLGWDKLYGGWGGARGGVPTPLPPQCFASGPPHKDPGPGFLGTAPPVFSSLHRAFRSLSLRPLWIPSLLNLSLGNPSSRPASLGTLDGYSGVPLSSPPHKPRGSGAPPCCWEQGSSRNEALAHSRI